MLARPFGPVELAFRGSSLPGTIVGTSSPGAASAALVEWVETRLAASVAACFHCTISVGVVFGVELTDGRRVAVKAHPPTLTSESLDSVQAAQSHLVESAFPAPRPLAGPAPFGATLAVADEWIDGEPGDFCDDRVVSASAAALAGQMRLLNAFAGPLPCTIAGETWPPSPHNALFDFGRDAEEARWIDEIALRARPLLDVGTVVVAHSDWSAKHVRYEGDRVCATYDWDSLRRDHEPVLVGFAAACHWVELDPLRPWLAEPGRVRGYLAAYESARGRPFVGAERRAALAAAAYLFAYTARCEHGYLGADGVRLTRMRQTLGGAAAALLG